MSDHAASPATDGVPGGGRPRPALSARQVGDVKKLLNGLFGAALKLDGVLDSATVSAAAEIASSASTSLGAHDLWLIQEAALSKSGAEQPPRSWIFYSTANRSP